MEADLQTKYILEGLKDTKYVKPYFGHLDDRREIIGRSPQILSPLWTLMIRSIILSYGLGFRKRQTSKQ